MFLSCFFLLFLLFSQSALALYDKILPVIVIFSCLLVCPIFTAESNLGLDGKVGCY